MQTYFFDYTVNSAYTCTEFAGTTPAEGSMFLVADVTVRNTDNRSIEMYDTDFQAQWGSDGEEDFRVPITYDTENQMDLPTLTDEQLPSTYTLAVDEERTGLLVLRSARRVPGFLDLLPGDVQRRFLRRHLLRLFSRPSRRRARIPGPPAAV